MGTPPMSTRPGRVLVIVVGALVAIAAAAAFVASLRPATTWDVDTPQGTVQAYVSAVLDGDTAEAATYLDPAGACDVSDLDRAAFMDVERVDLLDTHVDGATARVEVALAVPTGFPPTGAVSENHTFRLTRTPDGWRLVGTPWPLYDCGGVR